MVQNLTTEPIESYDINSIEIGLKKQFNVTITESMLDNFAQLSGDYNPLHMDNDYAKSTKFKKRVVHGMLLSSFFSRLVGMYLPGKNALYLTQSLKFPSPCFIDDEIIVEGEIISKSSSTKIITLKTQITNKSGENLVLGEAKVLIRD